MTKFFLLLALACPLLAGEPTHIYLEAERFDDVGGWTVDAQFRGVMGSTYLLAAGIGVPVADAKTMANIPQAGKYQLWVRCKDWDKTSPGAFQVLVNGNTNSTLFGTQKKPWAWVKGAAFDLRKGQAEIALRDKTGYYGRCDAVLLTTDLGFRPPDGVKALARFRDKTLGVPKATAVDYDFVVIGAGYGGSAPQSRPHGSGSRRPSSRTARASAATPARRSTWDPAGPARTAASSARPASARRSARDATTASHRTGPTPWTSWSGTSPT